jgi:hypothetical protein
VAGRTCAFARAGGGRVAGSPSTAENGVTETSLES